MFLIIILYPFNVKLLEHHDFVIISSNHSCFLSENILFFTRNRHRFRILHLNPCFHFYIITKYYFNHIKYL